MHYWGLDAGNWWLMGIGMAVWLIVAVIVIVVIVRAIAGPRSLSEGDSAEDVVRRRFAAGEIDADEYQRRLDLLRRR